jgi:hypothetical protein
MSDCFSLSLYASSKWAFVVLGIAVLSSLPLQSRALIEDDKKTVLRVKP